MPTYGLFCFNIWNWSITSCSVITMSDSSQGDSVGEIRELKRRNWSEVFIRAFDLSKGWVIILLFTLIGLDVVFLFLNWQIDLATLYHFPGGIDLSTNVFWSSDKYSFLTNIKCIHWQEHSTLFFFPKLISMLQKSILMFNKTFYNVARTHVFILRQNLNKNEP